VACLAACIASNFAEKVAERRIESEQGAGEKLQILAGLSQRIVGLWTYGERKQINRSHTHTHTDREQHPRHRHTHTHTRMRHKGVCLEGVLAFRRACTRQKGVLGGCACA